MAQLALTKAALLTPFALVEEATVLIDQGKIQAVGPYDQLPIPPGFREVPLDGLVLAPGLIDQHLHGGNGAAVMNGSAGQLVEIAKFHAANGVTSFLATATTGTRDQLVSVAKAFAALKAIEYKGARCLGLHLEGPYLAPSRAGIHSVDNLRLPNLEEVLTLHQISGQGVKMVTMAPELPGALKMAAALLGEGMVVSIGHSDADYDTAQAAILAGFCCATHCFNQMRPFHHRDPGVLGAVLTETSFPLELIADGVHLHPATLEMAWRMKGAEQLILVSDAMAPAGLHDGLHSMPEGQFTLEKQRLSDASGQLAGGVGTLIGAVKRMFEQTQCDLTGAFRMATYNPARLLGINKRKGSIYPGKDADIIALTPDLDVVMTMVGGEVISGLITL